MTGAQKDAGSYTATATGLSNGNYTLPTDAATAFTIGKRTAGLGWSDTAFTYDGKVPSSHRHGHGAGSRRRCEVTVTGGQKDAGSYTATATGLSNGNYVLPTDATTAFTIASGRRVLSWSDTAFTYDGDTHVPTATVTGLVPGDSCAVAVTGGQKDAGSYTATATGLSNGNYALAGDVTRAFTIGKRKAVSWSEDRPSPMTGIPTFPPPRSRAWFPGTPAKVAVTGAQKDAGSYTATATGLSNGNYALPEVVTTAFTIGKRTAGLSWSDTAFTYDGDTHVPTATVTGLLPGDTCAVAVTGAQKDAGSYTATATGLSNGNYALPEVVTTAFTIGKRTAGLSWSDTAFTYNGDTHVPTATVTGLLPGDACEVAVTGAQKDAGDYTATVTGLSNGNYILPADANQAFTIAQRTVGLKWTGTSLTYNGKTRKPRRRPPD